MIEHALLSTEKSKLAFVALHQRFGLDPKASLSFLNKEISLDDTKPILPYIKTQTAFSFHFFQSFQPDHLAALLEPAPQNKLPFFLSLLPEFLQAEVSKLLNLSPAPITHPLSQAFWEGQLYHYLIPKLPYPRGFLPEYKFPTLLGLSREKLLNVTDLMGLHLFLEPLKKIVERDQKEALHKVLLEAPSGALLIDYIRYNNEKPAKAQKKKIALNFPLQQWNKKAETLYPLIHSFGLFQFALAIAKAPEPIFNYLVAKFDSARLAKIKDTAQSLPPDEILEEVDSTLAKALAFLEQQPTQEAS